MAAPIRPLLLILGALLCGSPALAKKIYKFTDANGITHFTDQKPETDAAVQETVVRSEGQRMVGLRVEGHSGERQARVFNHLAGPAQVELRGDHIQNVTASPTLPLGTVLGPNEERVL